MTERGRGALSRDATTLRIGPSSVSWRDGALVIDIDEVGGLPRIGRLRGRVTLRPSAVTDMQMDLDAGGAHVWRPFAPTAEIDVALEDDGWAWSGHGYFDANFGYRALEADFTDWSWGRFPVGDATWCFYDARRRDGSRSTTALAFGADGAVAPITAPPLTRVRRTGWGLARSVPAEDGVRPRQALAMLDAPFYARAAIATRLGGRDVVGVHEALNLRRFRSPLLKPMLALRVPRRRS